MTLDLDRIIDRRSTESVKWHRYDEDVLPLWVADLDFPSPEPVVRALQERVAHGIFGYPQELPELRPTLVEYLKRLHGWQIEPEALVFLPDVQTGFNLAGHASTSPGDGLLVQTPIYHPILYVPDNMGCTLDQMELTWQPGGRYEVDLDRMADAIGDRTRIFILCNPHNPVGRVFRRDELEAMAELCLRHDLVICSDEIHCDLIFSGHKHTPIATLDPEVARRTITLIAPSKTYNIAGLKCSVAIVEDKELRERFLTARQGLVPSANLLGQVAGLAAYRDGGPWFKEVLAYLEANRDYLSDYVQANLPGIAMSPVEGTYLAWLDCRQAGLPGNPHEFFVQQARVALNDGATFGQGGEGFVRLNFGTPRAILTEALERMKEALAGLDNSAP